MKVAVQMETYAASPSAGGRKTGMGKQLLQIVSRECRKRTRVSDPAASPRSASDSPHDSRSTQWDLHKGDRGASLKLRGPLQVTWG